MLIFTAVGIFYMGFGSPWRCCLSLVFQKTVTAALASIAVWLFLSLFITIVASGLAGLIS